MANVLKESMVYSIEELSKQGWSQRRIARELGLSRTTVARYVHRLQQQGESGATPGSGDENQPGVPIGSDGQSGPGVPIGFEASQSLCLPHDERIRERLEMGLTAQRIYQDLQEVGFTGSYDSVKRYARRLREASAVPFRRLECPPGEEAQIDFGQGAPIIDGAGKRRRPHLFRIVLSHSRKAYAEVVWRQDTESVIRVLENAFRHFRGVPKTLVPDNMKCAVLHAEWADPELNPKLRDFCRHYATVLLPTKVRTPRHKGKVERGIGYVQENALKGRTFRSLREENEHLHHWERHVADTRLHGTTRQQVRAAFEGEQPHLLPLPDAPFPCFEEGERKVHRDGHVEVAKSYYSVPPEYVQRSVWVRWDVRTVRIFNPRTWQQIQLHACVEPGQFQTNSAHIPAIKIAAIEKGRHYLQQEIGKQIGEDALAWSTAMLKARGLESERVLVGLLGLRRKHSADALNSACRKARKHQRWRLRELRELLADSAPDEPDLNLQQKHPIIRDLSTYQHLIGDFSR